jgi:Fusaric acid resistance protein-like
LYGQRSLRTPVTAHSLRSGADAHPYDEEPPPAEPRRRPAWLDWLDATDPGQLRLRMALEVVVAIGVVLAVEWVFVRATGALQVPIPPKTPAAAAAELWTLNHSLTVIAMMLGAILAMVGGLGIDLLSGARAQLWFLLFLPVPMLALLALGLSVHVRLVSLVLLAVVLAAGTYCRRFGPTGFMGGMLAFMGVFLGFFIQDYVPLSDFGWLTAEILIGTAGTLAVHFALFPPRPAAALRSMQRSYGARARGLASELAELYEATNRSGESEVNRRAEQRLQQHLLRLNEAALLIDAQLGPATVPPGWSVAGLHQRLFDAEAGLGNVARFALALARRPRSAQGAARASALIVAALDGVRDGDLAAVFDSAAAIRELLDERGPDLTPDDRILLHRFATSVTDLGTALRAFRLYPASQPPDDAVPDDPGPDNTGPDNTGPDNTGEEQFKPQVFTFGGYLPGSAGVAGAASLERGGTGVIERIRLAPYARIAIQMGIAVSAAIIVGDAMSGRRFYWAVIAAFVTFMGANTAGEQVRKSVLRVLGTVVGVLAGAVLAHLVGNVVWLQVAVVTVSLFLGVYLLRINYAFMVVGITVMVSQLYVELDEFSNHLLLLRLAETSAGACVAILTVLLVLPLHVGRVARVAARQQVEALADLVDRCLDRLADPASALGSDLELRAAARRVDVAYQALVATVRPMRTPLFGSLATRVAGFTTTAIAARHYARNLLLDASTRYADLDGRGVDSLAAARRQLSDSVGAVTAALAPASGPDGDKGPDGTGPTARQYVRSASLFARVADSLPSEPVTGRPQLALRDLELLDGAFAEAARWAGVPVTDLDTVPG